MATCKGLAYEEKKRCRYLHIRTALMNPCRSTLPRRYGCSKVRRDQYVRDWGRNYGLKTVVFRRSSICGEAPDLPPSIKGGSAGSGESARAGYRQKGETHPLFTINGTGKQVQDVLRSTDLITLYKAAYENRDRAAGHFQHRRRGRTTP